LSLGDDSDLARPAGARTRRCGAILLILLAASAAACFGYWRYVYYPTTPQYALVEFLDAARNEDYAVAYGRLDLPGPIKLIVPSAEALRNLARRAGGLIPRLEDYRLGKVTGGEEAATIRTMLITRLEGAESSSADEVAIEMCKTDGRWKVDGGWVLRELVDRGGASLRRSLFR
jgi:hypothetical protein